MQPSFVFLKESVKKLYNLRATKTLCAIEVVQCDIQGGSGGLAQTLDSGLIEPKLALNR